MPAKHFEHLPVVLAVVLASTAGCFAAASESDGPPGGAVASSEGAFSLDDDQPGPLDHPVPVLPMPIVPPLHDLTPYLDELKRLASEGSGGCTVHYQRIWDPARGRELEVPITICD